MHVLPCSAEHQASPFHVLPGLHLKKKARPPCSCLCRLASFASTFSFPRTLNMGHCSSRTARTYTRLQTSHFAPARLADANCSALTFNETEWRLTPATPGTAELLLVHEGRLCTQLVEEVIQWLELGGRRNFALQNGFSGDAAAVHGLILLLVHYCRPAWHPPLAFTRFAVMKVVDRQ